MITKRDEKYFEAAKSVAKTSKHHKARIGCVLVNNRDIISVGVNGRKTHPLQAHYNKYRIFDNGEKCKNLLHAELDAIIKYKDDIPKGSKIYIFRIWKTGKVGIGRPCPGCMLALRERGINDIYYTTDEGYAYERLN